MLQLRRLVLAALSSTVAIAVAAQSPDSVRKKPLPPPPDMRVGFYGSVGIGYGSGEGEIMVNGATFSQSETSVTFSAGAGYTFGRHLRLGAEWAYFDASAIATVAYASTTGHMAFYSAAITWYPSAAKNFWAKGDLGYATFAVSRTGYASSEGGLAGGIGIGYDYRIGRSSYVFVPFVNYFGQFAAYHLSPDAYSNNPAGRVWLLQAGVGIGFRH